MAARFEILLGKKNKTHFVLKASNGQVVLTSETYETKAACKAGIASVRKNAVREGAFDLKTAKDGRPYFTLLAKNQEIIGSSQMYTANTGRSAGIRSVKTNAPTAPIVDTTV